MRRTTRAFVSALGAALALMAIPTPAQAKLPPFSVEWAPRTPAVGEEVTFIVRFWDDVAHTDRAGWVKRGFLEDLLWVFPFSAAPAEAIQLDLAPERPGVFRARVAFPSPGVWSVCAWETSCPIGQDAAGYPGRLELAVERESPVPHDDADVATSPPESRDRATTPPSDRAGSSSAPAAAAVVALALAGLAVAIRRAGSGQGTPSERSARRTR